MCITSIAVEAQRENVYSKVFDTNRLSTLKLTLENSTVHIETSDDGKIYIDYFIEFDNFSEKERRKRVDEIEVNSEIKENQIQIFANSLNEINKVTWNYDGPGELIFDYSYTLKKNKKKIFRKSKDSIIAEIGYQKYTFKPMAFDGKRFKVKERDGTIRNLRKKNLKISRSSFRIRIPRHIGVSINAQNANIRMGEDIINDLALDIHKGSFKAKNLNNELNYVKINDANFKVEEINGGEYNLNNVRNGLIGSLSNVNIISEFSKIEIGEIRAGAIITDFNSTYWFHNWSKDFKNFEMNAEYSKISLFHPETIIGGRNNFMLNTFGYHTVHRLEEDLFAEIPPNRDSKKNKMLVIGDESLSKNKVEIDIVHGIVNLYKDLSK